MILSGSDIVKQIKLKNIVIQPFYESSVGPNSYDLHLSDVLLCYKNRILDMKENNKYKRLEIPKEGIVLDPSYVYLGKTVEYTETKNLVPMLEGKSSLGRLGVFIHATAGFGDVGFKGFWTLEISCVQPVRIYPFVRIGQIYYHTIRGEIKEYNGKYQNQNDVIASRAYLDYDKKEV